MIWMLAVFFFAFINLELVFSLKYWTLSLKIQSLMSKEEQISSNMNRKITAIFWSLELLLFSGFVLEIIGGYVPFNDIDAFVVFQSISFVGTSAVCLGFISDAFRRLKKCLEHDKLGISTAQILTHILALGAATAAILTLILAIFINYQPTNPFEANLSARFEAITYSCAFAVVLVGLSDVPICFVMN